ncbi:hypothetical protein CTV96_09580 [Bacillus altitudinis]|uniref:hypothetical protein n=1 Tax=Bacillus altitudinis TaxID=293387 RepID=UPI000C24E140|nr:hypothetical protein [Bacillus altitudinis]PJI12388.1 hypothetical protein CTV96_09580 [Bacillus altitudinis]PKQ85598.1 hypothetical protein CTV98_007515 [Bacillus altitudinis]
MRGLSDEQQKSIRQGDVIIYYFGGTLTRAKVIQVYEGGYLDVRHKDFPVLNSLLGYRDEIQTSEVLGVAKSKRKRGKEDE